MVLKARGGSDRGWGHMGSESGEVAGTKVLRAGWTGGIWVLRGGRRHPHPGSIAMLRLQNSSERSCCCCVRSVHPGSVALKAIAARNCFGILI